MELPRLHDLEIRDTGTDIFPSVPRARKGQHFIKGPIPLTWLMAASHLPGRAVNMGLLIWYRVGLEGKNRVQITRKISHLMGMKKDTAARALYALERAGLIKIARPRGSAPVVTLLAVAEHGDMDVTAVPSDEPGNHYALAEGGDEPKI